jgi:hypothetical protein
LLEVEVEQVTVFEELEESAEEEQPVQGLYL